MEDHEYPSWLWSVLDQKVKSASEGQKAEVDPRLFCTLPPRYLPWCSFMQILTTIILPFAMFNVR